MCKFWSSTDEVSKFIHQVHISLLKNNKRQLIWDCSTFENECEIWHLRLFHFSFSSLLSTIPPNPIFLLLFLPICSQGQTFAGLFLYIEPHKEVHTCVRVNFLVFLVVRLAQPKDLWTGGWGKLWNLVVCTWLTECVNIYQRSRCVSWCRTGDPGTQGCTAGKQLSQDCSQPVWSTSHCIT